MKWALIKQHIVKPLTRRLGTMVAVGLVTVSPDIDPVVLDQVATGATAVALVVFDLVASYLERKRGV